MKVLTHRALLVVDEIGYLPISRTGAMLFFQLMTRRYRKRASTVLTSNKGFEEWGESLGDEVHSRRAHRSPSSTTVTWSRFAATVTACGSTLAGRQSLNSAVTGWFSKTTRLSGSGRDRESQRVGPAY
jgi:hypothetical protein